LSAKAEVPISLKVMQVGVTDLHAVYDCCMWLLWTYKDVTQVLYIIIIKKMIMTGSNIV